MRKFRWQIFISAIAIAVIAFFLSKPHEESIDLDIDQPFVPRGEYVEALVGSKINRLNPIFDRNNPTDRDINSLLYCRMFNYDDRGQPMPDLVESWGVSQDRTVYNFSLRNGATWHDGEPVTSHDIVFTLDILKDKSISTPKDIKELWKDVKVLAVDDQTLQFRLPDPYSPFLDSLMFGILPSHLLSDVPTEELINNVFNLKPIGCGPYKFENWLTLDGEIAGIELAANIQYYGKLGGIEKLVFLTYDTSEDALLAYKAGDVQGISSIDFSNISIAMETDGLNLYSSRLPLLSMIVFNLDDPQALFFREVEIRKALLMAINRQSVVDSVLDAQAFVAHGPIFSNSWAYYEGIPIVGYDPESAKEILITSGFVIPPGGGEIRKKEDLRLSFTLTHPDDDQHVAVAEKLAAYWRAIGVNIELDPVPYESLVSVYLDERDYQAVFIDISLAGSPDPDPYPFWHQTQMTGGQNYAMWNDRQASEYIEQSRIINDQGERQRLYRNFQMRFAMELPALPLYFPVYTYAVDEGIEGVSVGPLYDTSDRFKNIHEWILLP